MNIQFDELATTNVSRRNLMGKAMAGAAVGAAVLALPSLAAAQEDHQESVKTEEIHELQANFHRAKTFQDIDLMMSLWAEDAVFHFHGDHVGLDQIKALFLSGGSFTNRRLSLVASFKMQIEVHGKEAFLYFECVDLGNYDTAPFVASVLYLAGTVRKVGHEWRFSEMWGGPASPLSPDHYYYP